MVWHLPLHGVIFVKETIVAALFFYFPVWLAGRGATGAEIGSLMGAYTITAMLLLFPSGALADGASSRKLVAAGLLLSSASIAGLLAARSYPALLACFVLLGLSDYLARTTLQAVVFKTLPDDRAGAAAALNFTRCAGCATGLLGGALLVGSFDFETLFRLAASASLALAFAAPLVPEAATGFAALSSYRRGYLRRDVLLFSGAMFLFAFHWGAEGTSYALFVRETLGLGWTASGAFMALPIYVLAAASFPVARRIRQGADYARLMIFGFALSGLGHVAMTWPVVPWSFAIRVFHEVGDAIVGVVMLFGMSELFPAGLAGGLTALFGLVNMVGSALGALAYGPLGVACGYGTPLAVSGLLSLLAILPARAFRIERAGRGFPPLVTAGAGGRTETGVVATPERLGP